MSGFYKNGPAGTSIDCLGTRTGKLSVESDCSRETLNILDTDPTIGLDSGDDNVCKSVNCICGHYASPTCKVANRK